MSLKNDLMYPFGDPLADTFNETNLVALRNVLNLAKERVWIADGRPAGITNNEYSDFMDPVDLDHAKRSVELIDNLLIHIRKHKNENV